MQLDAADVKPVVTRMKRAHGHLATVIRMLEEGAECEDALTQLAAVNKALSKAGFALVATGMQECMRAADGDADAVDTARMEKLFLSFA
ncbi:metal-sensitive transcriptional regulator [Nocardioides yefusunii]|uniref:Metal-sensitive transcriptional regulator n=1 Tax=Nocardioides yefusunii TaxID=2500546 RepID=A0ABW1R1H1_9ACTN|nr:metal-sensitive transcriptional regulator [Nocardioides yefusunii]